MTEDSVSCLDCFFFKKTQKEDGECRRYPPVLEHLEADQQEAMEHDKNGEFAGRWSHNFFQWVLPIVGQDNWCGEFKHKKEGGND